MKALQNKFAEQSGQCYQQKVCWIIINLLMKSRLQSSIAELYKLKNQIRVQLNQIRPKTPLPCPQKTEKTNKKLFTHRFNESTSIVNPSAEKSKQTKSQIKRIANCTAMTEPQGNRSREKKHYNRHYDATLGLQNTVKRQTCSYFHVSPQRSPLAVHCHNTSLSGIGANDRQQSRSSKRINPKKYMCAADLF